MPQPNDLQEAQRLYGALTNQPTRLTGSPHDVLAALRAGEENVLVELPWNEVRAGETHERHQLVLRRVEGERVYFINALKTPGAPGTELGGPEQGPLRRIEEAGEESMPLANFVTLFVGGGQGMLRQGA